MIYLLVWPEHLETAARLAKPLFAALEGRMRLMATSQLAARDEVPMGAYVFTGVSGISGATRERFEQLERALDTGGATVVNRPSLARRPIELLREAGEVEIGTGTEIASWSSFPAVLNSHSATFTLDSPALIDSAQLRESLGRMVLSGCAPETIWIRSSPVLAESGHQAIAILRLGSRLYPAGAHAIGSGILDRAMSICLALAPDASLSTFLVGGESLVPWSVEDSATAALSGASQSGESLQAIADAWKQLLPTGKPVGSIRLR